MAVVGAGFTGLWTAYYLLREDPTLRVVVLEAETAGFGASGRNGGWCSALFPASLATRRRSRSSRADALAQHAAMRATVDEVRPGRARPRASTPHSHQGGTLVGRPHRRRSCAGPARRSSRRAWGDDDDVRLLDPADARSRLDVAGDARCDVHTGLRRIHPARLVRGLARAVERRGARSTSRPGCRSIEPGRVVTDRRHGHAPRSWCGRPRATRRSLDGQHRAVVPVYSLIVATEPLPDASGTRSGWRHGETFTDHRHLIVYGQRTADDRLVFGGRGAPYHFGSASPAGVRPGRRGSSPMLRATLRGPASPRSTGARFTHAWGGPLGIAARLDGVASGSTARGRRLGGWLRRRRRRHHQPGRPHPRRPRARPRHRADPAAVGQPPLARAGSRSRCAGSASTPGCG